jgi:hypothetical protein
MTRTLTGPCQAHPATPSRPPISPPALVTAGIDAAVRRRHAIPRSLPREHDRYTYVPALPLRARPAPHGGLPRARTDNRPPPSPRPICADSAQMTPWPVPCTLRGRSPRRRSGPSADLPPPPPGSRQPHSEAESPHLSGAARRSRTGAATPSLAITPGLVPAATTNWISGQGAPRRHSSNAGPEQPDLRGHRPARTRPSSRPERRIGSGVAVGPSHTS